MLLFSVIRVYHDSKKILLSTLVFILILIWQPTYGLTTGILQGEDITIYFDEPLIRAAEETVRVYPALKHDLEEIFRWTIGFRPTVILFNDSDHFQRTAGSRYIIAYAVPNKNLVVIDYSKMKTDPFTLEGTLKHELCHLLLHSHIPEGRLPKWLDEGVAQWVSAGLADIITNQKGSILNQAVISHRYIPLRALAGGFPSDRGSLILAYEESRHFIEFIIHEYGLNDLLMVLSYLKTGNDIESAVQNSLSISFEELERKWYNGLSGGTAWFMFLANHIYEMVFFLVSLALIYGFIKIFLRKRAYARLEEDDHD